ncbi:MAG TPA: hypothetical protein VIL71_19505 [Spirillospora sp.]
MSVPEYRVLFTVDIEDYSSRKDAEQRTLQTALDRALDDAADRARLDRRAWRRQYTGDGVNVTLPRGADVGRLMDEFVRELDAGLAAYNRRRAEETWTRLRVRMAVHVGLIHLDGAMGWPGRHAVQPARLRDSEPLRAAMRARPEADLGVIVSSEIYNDYISQGPGRPQATEFQAVRVEVKKQRYTAYLYMPGFRPEDIPELAAYAPEEGAEGGEPPRTAPQPRDAGSPAAPSQVQATNVAYGGDAFGGDKVLGDKHVH